MFAQLEIATKSRVELIDVTAKVEEAVKESKVGEGVAYLFVPHTTAGILINENDDPAVAHDILTVLENIAPREAKYRHTEGNADSHLKTVLVGSSQAVPVQRGRLTLGTWQGIFLCEFDGPRKRRLLLQVISEEA